MTTQRLRPRSARPIAVVLGTVALAGAALISTSGMAVLDVIFGLGAMLLLGFVGYWLFWLPAVFVDDSGLTLVNPLQTIYVPWPALKAVNTKYSLTVQTTEKKFSAWAAPASGMVREGVTRGNYAQIAAGLIEAARAKPAGISSKEPVPPVQRRIHWIIVGIAIALVLLTALSALFSAR